MSDNDSPRDVNRQMEKTVRSTSSTFGVGRGLTQLGTDSGRTPAEKLAMEAAKEITESWGKSNEEEAQGSIDTKYSTEPLEGEKVKKSTSFKDELKDGKIIK